MFVNTNALENLTDSLVKSLCFNDPTVEYPEVEKAKEDDGVIAEWYPDQPNRSSAPDVTAGEEVELYKFADSDVFYWKATNISSKNRSHETIVVSAANKAQKDNEKIPISVNMIIKKMHV